MYQWTERKVYLLEFNQAREGAPTLIVFLELWTLKEGQS